MNILPETPLRETIRERLTARTPVVSPDVGSSAAVLILVYPKHGEEHILFTKRTMTLAQHAGEISFPGGMFHPSDRTMVETALRESEEEVGVAPTDVNVLGRLDDFVSIFNIRVEPYVGAIREGYEFRPNPDEIDRLIEVPITHLLDPRIFRAERWEREGRSRNVYFFEYGDDIIWGLTAAMLRQFLMVVFDARL